jgi:hypothetical protein
MCLIGSEVTSALGLLLDPGGTTGARKFIYSSALFSSATGILGLPTAYVSSVSSMGLQYMGAISDRTSYLFSTGMDPVKAYVQTRYAREKGSFQS